VLEKDGGIVFLRRLKEGPAAESYGLHVARLAGLSPAVLDRARQIMDNLLERDVGLGAVGVNHKKPEVNEKEDSHGGTEGTETTENKNFESPPCPPCKQPWLQQPKVAPCLREMPSEKAANAVLRELAALDPDAVTPLEALALVSGWKKRLAGGAKPRAAKAEGGKSPNSTPSLFD